MAQELSIVVKAKDDASRALTGINGKIQQMSKQLRMAGIAMTAVGGAITAALGMSIKSFAKAGDEVHKMALRTGFATETLSELKHALEISGASLSAVDKASKTMSKAIADGVEGLSTYVREFDRLGISAQDLVALKPEEQFMTIALAIADLEHHYEKAAAAQVIFGRAGTQMLPLLDAGADGINALRQEAHDLGIVFDQEAANKAAEFNDSLTRLKGAVSGLKFQVANVLTPAITALVDWITAIIAKVREWGEAHPVLYAAMAKVVGLMGLFMVAAGPILIMLPFLAKGIVMVAGFMLKKLIPSMVAVIRVIYLKIAAWFKMWAAMGPAGWAIIGGIIAAFGILTLKLIEYRKQVEATIQSTLALTGGLYQQGAALDIVGGQWEDYADAIEGATSALGSVAIAAGGAATATGVMSDQMRRATFLAEVGTKALAEYAAGTRDLTEKQIAFHERNIEKYENLAVRAARITGLTVGAPVPRGAVFAPYKAPMAPYPLAPGEARRLASSILTKAVLGLPYRKAISAAIPGFQAGGMMPFTGLAHLEKGETVLPARGQAPIQNIIHIYLDGDEVTTTVMDRIAEKMRLQGAY